MYVDFDKLRAEVPIMDVANLLGLILTEYQPEKGPKQFRGRCPIHDGRHPRQFVITPDKGLYFCHSDECNSGGGIVQLYARVKRYEGTDGLKKAADEIATHFKVGGHSRNASKAPEVKRFDPEAYLAKLDPTHEALAPLGLSEDTLRLYRAGYVKDGVLRGRLAVGFCDQEGKLESFVGLALDQAPPSLPKGFDPEATFFNAHNVNYPVLTVYRSPVALMRDHPEGTNEAIAVIGRINLTMLENIIALMRERGCEEIEVF